MEDSQLIKQALEELQSQMAFQDDTINSLNEAIAEQQQEILVLRRQLALLKQRQDEFDASRDEGAPVADEKPPHY